MFQIIAALLVFFAVSLVAGSLANARKFTTKDFGAIAWVLFCLGAVAIVALNMIAKFERDERQQVFPSKPLQPTIGDQIDTTPRSVESGSRQIMPATSVLSNDRLWSDQISDRPRKSPLSADQWWEDTAESQ